MSRSGGVDAQELVQQALAGDHLALKRLLLRCHNPLMSLIRADLNKRVRCYVEPEDVLHEVYTSALRSFDAFAGRDVKAFQRWLNAIARNKVRETHHRLRARRAHGDAGAGLKGARLFSQSMSTLTSALSAHLTSATGRAVKVEASEALAAALAVLPDHYRQIVELRYIEELTVDETASRTGRTRGAVMMITHRALRQLARELREFPLLTRP